MGSTTFDGPIKAGTIFNTTGTTVGTNVSNVGFGVCAQSDTLSKTDTTTKDLDIYLPKDSEIVSIEIDILEGFDAGTDNLVDMGDSGSADRYMKGWPNKDTLPTRNTPTGAAFKAITRIGNYVSGSGSASLGFQCQNWYNVTTVSSLSGDVRLNAIYTPTGSAVTEGEMRITVMYIPGRNLSAPLAWSL